MGGQWILPGSITSSLGRCCKLCGWGCIYTHVGWLSCPVVSSDLSPILTWNTLSTIHPAHTCTVPH